MTSRHREEGVPLEQHWLQLAGWAKIFSAAGLTILVLTTAMALTTYISQRQLMNKQTAQVNPQQQMIMKIMPLMFFVFAINVPLAVIIYWVTTNFWSVGQQWMLLRTHPVPTGDVQAAPAGAPALVENGEGRKGLLGQLSMFRGSSQSRATEERSPATNKNGNPNATTGNGKASPNKASPNKASPKQGGPAAKGAQAKPSQGQSGRQGTSGNRRSGSRSSGKGKSSGPRRGKR